MTHDNGATDKCICGAPADGGYGLCAAALAGGPCVTSEESDTKPELLPKVKASA